MNERQPDEVLAAFTEILKQLVDEPDELRIGTSTEADGSLLIRVEARGADKGKVIGRKGRTAGALRVLLGAVGAARKVRYKLDIVDEATL